MSLRYDRIVSRFDFAPGAEPSAGVAAAQRTEEGYLVVDAYLARDGVLKYSDGRTTWHEYRPREELRQAAASWADRPITDGHPDRMVDARTYRKHARGHVMSAELLPPDGDGVSYLRGKVLIADADLVQKIEAGVREVSIGFLALTEAREGTTERGDSYQAVQRALRGNHVAIVKEGRAGPAVRLLLDSASCDMIAPPMSDDMIDFTPYADIADPSMGKAIGPDGQEVTAPMWLLRLAHMGMEAQKAMGKAIGPDGQEITAPMWLLHLARMGTEAQKAEEAPPEVESEPAIDLSGSAPAAQKKEDMPPMPPMDPEKPRTESATDLVTRLRVMRKLERFALSAGVPEERVDAADDEAALCRTILGQLAPDLDTARYTQDQLNAAIAAVRCVKPAQTELPPKPAQFVRKTDTAVARLAEILKAQDGVQ